MIAPDDKCRAMCEKNKGILCNKMARWESSKEENFNLENVKSWSLQAADHFTTCYDLGRSANDEDWTKKLGIHMQETWNIMFSILTKIDGDAPKKIKLIQELLAKVNQDKFTLVYVQISLYLAESHYTLTEQEARAHKFLDA